MTQKDKTSPKPTALVADNPDEVTPSLTSRKAAFTREMLNMPTPPEFTEEKQGMTYMQNEAGLDWLDYATGGEYNYEVRDFGFLDYMGECTAQQGAASHGTSPTPRKPIIAFAVVRIEIPALGVYKDGVGANVTFFKENDKTVNGAETCIKGAESSALKRALRKFGPGADLYPNSDRARSIPVLPLRAIGVLMHLMGLTRDEFFTKASVLVGKELAPEQVKSDPELAHRIFLLMEQEYLHGS